MSKIKVEKQMTLPELIEYAWENGVRNKNFTSSENGSVGFDGEGLVTTIAVGRDETFTVEEEVNEDTEIGVLYSIENHKNDQVHINFNCSINQIYNHEKYNYYILNDDDTLTLIYRNGEMVE
ncbi:hypothetical protein FH178_10500 [Staphylococcus caprae]|uniref:hypothetical protein n=1 Tax=Staphylococcus caprae TaxID=29380 RepID=UPI001F56760F|nr:hypothetical protein [Staphylococcus caprae]MCI2955622.1 hypothetical protein [Staphylococcus caprae]